MGHYVVGRGLIIAPRYTQADNGTRSKAVKARDCVTQKALTNSRDPRRGDIWAARRGKTSR